jgi:hypothetical protein
MGIILAQRNNAIPQRVRQETSSFLWLFWFKPLPLSRYLPWAITPSLAYRLLFIVRSRLLVLAEIVRLTYLQLLPKLPLSMKLRSSSWISDLRPIKASPMRSTEHGGTCMASVRPTYSCFSHANRDNNGYQT